MDRDHDQARLFRELAAGLVSETTSTCPSKLTSFSSQAMDVGTLKSLPAETIRILVWILSFLTFGLATEEFEVTSERLGVYRPEEHIEWVLRSQTLVRLLIRLKATRKTMRIMRMCESMMRDYGHLSARSSSTLTRGPA